MPRLLKRDSIRLIEASIESLALAQLGICSFHRTNHKQKIVRYAPETGLIGTAIELAMSSVLVQAFDRKVVMKTGQRFKTASEILEDFRALIRQNSPNLVFLTNGINKKQEHLQKIYDLTSRFKIIIISRANAFHSGIGLNYDVLASIFQEVSWFIKLLAKSNNYKPYVSQVPKLITISKDKDVLIEELYNSVNSEPSIESQKNNIASLFLLLPEVPKEMPEWVQKFERFNISPKEEDIIYLTNALKEANPISLKKSKGGNSTLVAKIDPSNPNAIPIKPHYLKTSFNNFKDQFYADISTANGRLENNQLDLPPTMSVMRCFAYGLKELNLLDEGQEFLNAHQAWPSIATAVKLQSTSICFPLWYMVRKTEDLGQLISILKRTKKIGNKSYQNNIDDVIFGIEAIINNKAITFNRDYYSKINSDYQVIQNNQSKLSLKPTKTYNLGKYYKDIGIKYEEEKITVEELMKLIKEEKQINSIDEKKFWLNKLAGTVLDLDSLPLLFEIYEDENYRTNRTQIKKNMRVVDFITFGPKIKN